MVCYNWCPEVNINKIMKCTDWFLVTIVACPGSSRDAPFSWSGEVFSQPLFQGLHSTMDQLGRAQSSGQDKFLDKPEAHPLA